MLLAAPGGGLWAGQAPKGTAGNGHEIAFHFPLPPGGVLTRGDGSGLGHLARCCPVRGPREPHPLPPQVVGGATVAS